MFLHQFFGYSLHYITSKESVDNMVKLYDESEEDFMVFDTETDGLHIVKNTPFLFVGGFEKHVFIMDFLENEELSSYFLDKFYELAERASILLAHNTEFDVSMMMNYGKPIPDTVKLGDTMTVYRLVEYSDLEKFESLRSLEAIGVKYVHDSAKFAGKAIKERIAKMNSKKKSELRASYLQHFNFKAPGFNSMFEYAKKNKDLHRFIPIDDEVKPYVEFIWEHFEEATYLDVYKSSPDLMYNYAVDDIVLVREFFIRAFDTLKTVDEDLVVFYRECDLIRKTVRQMRTGLRIDKEYLVSSYYKLKEYQDKLYAELHQLLGLEVTSSQNKVIGDKLEKDYFIRLPRTDKGNIKLDNQTLVNLIQDTEDVNLKRIGLLIKKLRTVDKYVSTYIVGAMKQESEGRIHPNIDASGTVSGRYSGNLQQLPRNALMDNIGDSREEVSKSKELFHARKLYIPDDDYILAFYDYSQQELRIQAYLTILIGHGDIHLCRAYIPYECESFITGEPFDYTKKDHLERVDSGEWILKENGEAWVETDVHSLTTENAFEEFVNDENNPYYDYYRSQGKTANFLKLYLGGVKALQESLECTIEVAEALDNSFRNTYLGVTAYQESTMEEAQMYGYVENVYNRRYYLFRSRNAYKLANYRIQGTGADMIKTAELMVEKLTKGLKSYSSMTVHDEIVMAIHKDELYLIPLIEKIMYEAGEPVKYIPMKVGIDYTTTSWGDAKPFESEELVLRDLEVSSWIRKLSSWL